MKKTLLLFLIFIVYESIAQGVWTQKANFPGGGRFAATGFSIGTKGYIGTGWGPTYMSDLWEWDQATNTWAQKADYSGGSRMYAVSFSIGTKGYIGTGSCCNNQTIPTDDFWEWDQASNTWTQKADFGGGVRLSAVGLSIGGKGYIGTGYQYNLVSDFWEWDPTTNIWSRKADFPGVRSGTVGFSIGHKGYIGMGESDTSKFHRDFWEYDLNTDTWTRKADLPGTRNHPVGFSIGSKGYIGTANSSSFSDFWEWDQATDTWTQKANCTGGPRFHACGFSIGDKGYIGTGLNGQWYPTKYFWEYSASGVGIQEEINEINAVLFPNPSAGVFTIQSTEQISEIEISNSLGEKVYSEEIERSSTPLNKQIDLSTLPKGIYFVKINSEKNLSAQKIIIE